MARRRRKRRRGAKTPCRHRFEPLDRDSGDPSGWESCPGCGAIRHGGDHFGKVAEAGPEFDAALGRLDAVRGIMFAVLLGSAFWLAAAILWKAVSP